MIKGDLVKIIGGWAIAIGLAQVLAVCVRRMWRAGRAWQAKR